MRQQFDEPTQHSPNTDMGWRVSAPEERTRLRPKAGGINLGLVAIFGLPLLIIAGLLQSTKKYVDVMDEADQLEARVEVAKKQGFPFTAAELAKDSAGKTNSAPLLKEYFMNSDRPIGKEYMEVIDRGTPTPPELKKGMEIIVGYAHKVAACEVFDPKYDFDLGFSLALPDYAYLKNVLKVLSFDARQAAIAGNEARALESLSAARKLCEQMGDERPLIGMLVNIACQGIYYRSLAEVGIEFANRPDVVSKVRDLMQDPIPVPKIDKALHMEFYAALAYLRNLDRMGGLAPAANIYSNGIPAQEDLSKPIVRGGFPKSAAAQGLLAKALQHYQNLVEIVLTEPDPVVAGKKMDQYAMQLDTSVANLFSGILLPVFSQASSARAKPETYHAMAEWAVDIETKYHGKYPESLAPRTDPGLRGQLIYRKIGDQFLLYSTAENRVDDGGPSNHNAKKNRFTDDYGLMFPMKISPTSKTSVRFIEGRD
ncbi:MAG TPA: hypothetical protein VK171_02485 [Fimbriimonas sp.]|nr:hypothetical protein [Fimbriimonas sp.]